MLVVNCLNASYFGLVHRISVTSCVNRFLCFISFCGNCLLLRCLFCISQCWILINCLDDFSSFVVNCLFGRIFLRRDGLTGAVLGINCLDTSCFGFVYCIGTFCRINGFFRFVSFCCNCLLLRRFFCVSQCWILINCLDDFSSFFINGFLSVIFTGCNCLS